MKLDSINDKLFLTIKELVFESRNRIFRKANSELLLTYWNIGKLIIEDEQIGEKRAEYGKKVLKNLASALFFEFGKGFDESNLRNMRAFYLAFPKCDALRHELSWTHYRARFNEQESEKNRNID